MSFRDYEAIDRARAPGHRHRNIRLRRYYADARILIISIPTRVHELLHLGLYQRFTRKLSSVTEDWLPMGTTTLRARGAPGGHGGGGGEGDSTGGPEATRGKSDSWPTLVIEAGYSESLVQLRRDMEWWFTESNHDVKIVVLVKLDRAHNMIVLEKWQEEQLPAQPGIPITRSAPLVPVLRQNIEIHRDITANPPAYNVTRGALVLGFRDLFLRNPRRGEGNFVFSVQELGEYARVAWERDRV